jgi:lysozyme
MQRVSQRGIDLIQKHEGLRLQSYVCPAGKWTIGYGHTRTARPGQQITAEQAEELLRQDIAFAELAVRALGVQLRQGQYDALVSFVYNVGVGAFRNSTLRQMVIDRKPDAEVAAQFGRWVYAGNRRLPGLVNRRNDEAALYLS